MKVEFSPEEWANRSKVLRPIRIDHQGCGGDGHCYVFVCRDRVGYSCGRYSCQETGGSEDNRCADCWCAFEKALPRVILEHLSTRSFAREDAMCRHFGCYDKFTLVEDALFQLVREGDIEWFGSDQKPLKYRLTGKGREFLAALQDVHPRHGRKVA